MRPKISIIVPIFNAGNYLRKCIDSILSQSFTDFELLLINDGSIDDSREICDAYAINDSRIRVFHKSNEGISVTRNLGINSALGELISFVDADDWLAPNYYTLMYDSLIENDADIVWCDFYMVYDNQRECRQMFEPCSDKINLLKLYLSFGWNVVWNMLVKRSLYIDYDIKCFNGYNFTEDYGLTSRLVFYAKKISYVHTPLYYYNRTNIYSIVHKELDQTKQLGMTNDEIAICCLVNDFYKRNGVYEVLEKELSWRLLKAKRGWLYRKDKLECYLALFPESNKYIDSNPFCNRKDKFCQKIILSSICRLMLPIIKKLNILYKTMK